MCNIAELALPGNVDSEMQFGALGHTSLNSGFFLL